MVRESSATGATIRRQKRKVWASDDEQAVVCRPELISLRTKDWIGELFWVGVLDKRAKGPVQRTPIPLGQHCLRHNRMREVIVLVDQ